ncbi:MAG: ThuA domain-containing protein [Bacteroidia bacterium]|nr:ThuA domain-containing protein [Bacteroidia bacterium]
MNRFLPLLLVAVLVCVWYACQRPLYQRLNQPRKIEVLFLGHASEHHNSQAYLPILASALTHKGINFTYTDNPDDLNPELLSHYDAVMIYANHDSMTDAQEKALLDYVRSGRGFLPIHCASHCFRNKSSFLRLVGGRFDHHGTGTFTATLTDTQHPVTAGLVPFETWDETYVHSGLSNDRTVLMERVDSAGREPWTWVRQEGKGRVFYTAYGHDERTWSHPGFHALIEKAIVWSVGDDVRALWSQLPAMPKLTYQDAVIPNYEKRDPPPRLQLPLSAEESMKLIQVPEGFEVSLFASEPDIINPISMAWDERGRLWVIETVDYPNTVRDEDGVGDDRIKILEDTNGDGKADKVTVFAENLNIPTSLVFANGGVIVAQAPHFLFLKDTNGDDKADERRILITGWGKSDTHAGPSNLAYGLDNQIYGTVGYAGYDGTVGGKKFTFGQGFYRFASDASSFEFLTRTSNNTWGLGITEDFQVFGSTANNTHSVHMPIPKRYFEAVKGLPGNGSHKIDGHYAFHPLTRNVRQVDVFNGFTAAAGHNFYTARSFPSQYWNRIAFVCEPTGRLVHNAVIEPNGSSFKEKDGWNFMASSDEWFAPVDAEVGPDGALWVLDWYDFIIQHNPTPPGFENGKGNAHINPLRDRDRGRIYRVSYRGAAPVSAPQLRADDPKGLVAALGHENMFWRLTAQRLLVERGQADVAADLVKLIKSSKPDALGLQPAALHALWTLHGLGLTDGKQADVSQALMAALSSPTPAIRRAAIQIVPRDEAVYQTLTHGKLLRDPDLAVRLEAFLALSEYKTSQEAGEHLYALSKDPVNVNDMWVSQAIYCAASRHQAGFVSAYLADESVEHATVSVTEAPFDFKTNTDWSQWKTMKLPERWENAGLDEFDGIVWFKKEIDIPANLAGQRGTLYLAKVDDTDTTYVNGRMVGQTYRKYDAPRAYPVAAGTLKAGSSILMAKVVDYSGGGGIWGTPQELYLQVGDTRIDLAGDWYYRVEKAFATGAKNMFDAQHSIADLFYRENGANAGADMTGGDAAPAVTLKLKVQVNQMKYDLSQLSVPAGQRVAIVFENPDFMQHNLLILAAGSLDKVGAAADALAQAADGAAQNYVPDMPEVLAASPLVDPNTSYTLVFTAPEQPGDYPFVCTFPGHWRMMNGILKVVPPTASLR